MKNSNNKLNLFIGNFVLVALLVAALVCYWVIHTRSLGNPVNLTRVIPVAFVAVIGISGLRAWLALKLKDENG